MIEARLGPLDKSRAHLLERRVKPDAHRADDDDHRENRIVLSHVERIEQDVAGAGLPRDHLAGHHGDQRQHQTGAAAGENFRQRRRQHDPDHALRRRQAHGRTGPQHLFLDGFRALKAVIDHRQADAEEDHQRLGDVADAEPEHDDRHQRRLRHRIDHHQQRIEERRHGAAAAHHQSERDRDGHRQAKADRHAAQRGQDVDQGFLVAKDGRDGADRLQRGRKAVIVQNQ